MTASASPWPASGEPVPAHEFPEITREQLRAYAEASGDDNPIHLDDDVARKAGLPGVIAHGMLAAGLMAERAQAFLREQTDTEPRITGFQIRFKAMVFPGDRLRVSGVVGRGGEGMVALDLVAHNPKGEVVATANVSFAPA